MSFHSWYSKSIIEAQERYKKEDKESFEAPHIDGNGIEWEQVARTDATGSLVFKGDVSVEDDEDLLRFEDDGGWHGI